MKARLEGRAVTPAGAGNNHQFGDDDIPENSSRTQVESGHFRQQSCFACVQPPFPDGRQPEGILMPAIQGTLALTLPNPSRRPGLRQVRRPFYPSPAQGPYRLPRDVQDHLVAALQGYRNRDAAMSLATFLGR